MASKEELDEAAMEEEKQLRQKRIDTAVRFLQNPKVVQTPLSRKKVFLEKKGLKKDEIEEAIRLSGTPLDEHPVAPISPARPLGTETAPASSIVPTAPPPVPWRGYMVAAILGGGIGYTIAHLFKAFILPYFYHKKSAEEEKLEAIETTVKELKENVTESVQKTLDSVQGLLEQQQTKLQSLALDLASTQSKVALLPSESYTVGDLKGEILSLKGLLLNRKQFPSPMVGSTPAAPPSIPAWQRTVTSTERTSTTSSLTDSDTTGAAELSNTNSHEQSASKVSLQYASMNGNLPKPSVDNGDAEEYVEIHEAENSHTERGSTSSSETDTANTPKTVVSANERSLNDAMLNDSSVLSSETSLSSMSELSGNTSFHDTSIAFSSTCIKAPSDMTLPSDSIVDSTMEGVNDSAVDAH
ncbi:peroxisomal membrane protein PEX14-like [Montipora capricornis]|uniref:peroxisomal membrane protein PEX14-like n=1 Tax=Montipora capricornis TaxID=246305 RepID=UPI0035F1FE0A